MHEHVAEPAQRDAERLLDATGGAELAKLAIDVAEARKRTDAERQEAFARSLGIGSYEELLRISKQVDARDRRTWHVTPVLSAEWVAWNVEELQERYRARSERDARRYVTERRVVERLE